MKGTPQHLCCTESGDFLLNLTVKSAHFGLFSILCDTVYTSASNVDYYPCSGCLQFCRIFAQTPRRHDNHGDKECVSSYSSVASTLHTSQHSEKLKLFFFPSAFIIYYLVVMPPPTSIMFFGRPPVCLSVRTSVNWPSVNACIT